MNLPEITKDIIQFWSAQPHLRDHSDPTRKVYGKSQAALELLLTGEFGRRCPLSLSCMDMNDLFDDELNKQWPPEEIKQAIERYNYMCGPDYVADKQYFPRTLDQFIYNPRSEHSFIMSLLGEQREVSGRPEPALDQTVVNMYRNTFFPGHIDDNVYQKLIKCTNYIVMQQRQFTERVGQHCYFHDLKDEKFYKKHIQYIELNYMDREDFRVDHIGALTYQGFPVWLKEFHGLRIYYSAGEIQAIKEKYVEDTKKIAESEKKAAELLLERENWLNSKRKRGLR